jgi:predicted nucleic acid-binding protein
LILAFADPLYRGCDLNVGHQAHATPPTLWTQAAELGQACRQKNITVNSLDLLIATIALCHGAEVVTFDDDFPKIATVSKLQVKLLKRPTP